MLVPLYGFLQGDTLGVLVLTQDQDTVASVAANLQLAAAMRVRALDKPRVFFNGRALDPALSVRDAGLSPLDRIEVREDDTR